MFRRNPIDFATQQQIDNFLAKVEKTPNCWNWLGKTLETNGRGSYKLNGKMHKAARVMYWYTYGPFDLNLNVCHKCDVPNCVNPEHLFLGTQSENMKDCSKKNRLILTGDNNPNAALTSTKVINIRKLYQTGRFSFVKLAKQYKVNPSTVERIIKRKTWKTL